jgi:hypothetical protein
MFIADISGAASPGNAITITTTGGIAFNGGTSVVLNTPYGRVSFIYNGSNFIISS